MPDNTAVLLLVFNRPLFTSTVFEVIRKAKPEKLFIAADGPRTDNPVDSELCEQVRSIVNHVDWKCELKTLFRDNNLGCGRAVSEGISWFFDHVEQGIILEDDCLPDPSFFSFCDTLLNQYKDDKQVMSISGTNLLPGGWKHNRQSYLFAHGGIWGWATWSRAWKLYDFNMAGWEHNREKIRAAMKNDHWFKYYSGLFDVTSQKKLDTWDVQWFYCILNNGLAINPSVNLVKNIGFGSDSTHTADSSSPYSELKVNSISFPLKDPEKMETDREYLKAIYLFITGYQNIKGILNKSRYWFNYYIRHFKRAY